MDDSSRDVCAGNVCRCSAGWQGTGLHWHVAAAHARSVRAPSVRDFPFSDEAPKVIRAKTADVRRGTQRQQFVARATQCVIKLVGRSLPCCCCALGRGVAANIAGPLPPCCGEFVCGASLVACVSGVGHVA